MQEIGSKKSKVLMHATLKSDFDAFMHRCVRTKQAERLDITLESKVNAHLLNKVITH